jgi:hypothetical protein
MKYVLIVICALSLIFAGIAIGQVSPRFEHVYTQTLELDGFQSTMFNVYHDKSSGQEIVCVLSGQTYASAQCYLTGRKW